jgi:hypothetical protein
VPVVIPVDMPPATPPPLPRRMARLQSSETPAPVDEGPRRSFLEIMLDPNTIRWLLGSGGALFVIGLIIWLTSIGLFANDIFAAIGLGVGNAILLGAGYWLILGTRFKSAGLALTLLACLTMPLNLWFYHSHGLLTLENNLWIAAVVCCVVYVASALILRDSLFVYVLVGGVTLTGMLILAQLHLFGQIFAPICFLVTLGLICMHAERAFPAGDSPFSREKFGLAFFWSAQALLAVGLLLLMGAQLIGWLHEPVFHLAGPRPDVATRDFLPLTLGIVLLGTYAYIYSDLVVRQIGVYIYLAAVTLLWGEILGIVYIDPTQIEAIVIVTLALTGLAVNLAHMMLPENRVLRTVPPLGVLLSLVAVVFGIVLHFRATNIVLHRGLAWPFEISWWHVGAMAVAALCCRAGAYVYRQTHTATTAIYFFATGASTLVAAAALAWMLGLHAWETQAPLVMLIPIVYLIASYLYRGQSSERPLVWVAHAATVVMILCSLWAAVMPEVFPRLEGPKHNLLLATFCLEAAVFYGIAGVMHRSQVSLYLSAATLGGAVWQLLVAFDTPAEIYPVVFALAGTILLVIYRTGLFERFEMPTLERAVFQSANALTTLGFVAGALLSLTRLPMHEDAAGEWRDRIKIVLYLQIFLIVINVLSAWIVQHAVWRRVHLVLTAINGILLLLVIHKLSTMSPWQRLEIVSIIVGSVVLILAHVGWYREKEQTNDLVSFAFPVGALALVVPLLIGNVYARWFRVDEMGMPAHIHTPGWNDLGLVVSCIALLLSGILCRIRATTLIGTAAMAAYLLVVLVSLIGHLREVYAIGIYITIGGALLFGTGIALSIYRDKLLTLPDRIKRREGVFTFFDWR